MVFSLTLGIMSVTSDKITSRDDKHITVTNLLTLSNNVYLVFYDKHITVTNLLTLSNNVYLVFYAKEIKIGT